MIRAFGNSRPAIPPRSLSLSSSCFRSSSWLHCGAWRLSMMAAYLSAWRAPRRRTLRLLPRYAAAIVVTVVFLFPIYWLFMISFKTPEEIFPSPPVWYPARIQFANFAVLFKDGDAVTVGNSLVIAGVQHVDLPCFSAPMRLQPRALQDRRRESGGLDHLAAHGAARSRSCSRCFCSTYGSAGSIPIYGPDPPLYRLQPALRDLDDARLYRGHSARS